MDERYPTEENEEAVRYARSRKRHQCDDCSKSFVYNRDLKRHWRKEHRKDENGESPVASHKCDDCSKPFIQKAALNRHWREVHRKDENGERLASHKCVVCSKHFSQKSSLNRHWREAHRKDENGERIASHKCVVCSKHFMQKSSLIRHWREVHHKKEYGESLDGGPGPKTTQTNRINNPTPGATTEAPPVATVSPPVQPPAAGANLHSAGFYTRIERRRKPRLTFHIPGLFPNIWGTNPQKRNRSSPSQPRRGPISQSNPGNPVEIQYNKKVRVSIPGRMRIDL